MSYGSVIFLSTERVKWPNFNKNKRANQNNRVYQMENKLSEYDFLVKAIKKLRKRPYKGIHSVYSGFNQAFRDYFNKDPVEVTTKLAKEGKIVLRPVRGGVTLYLPEDAPEAMSGKSALDKILEENKSEENLEVLGPVDDEGDS